MKKILTLLFCGVLINAYSSDFTWIAGGDGILWSNPANWDDGGEGEDGLPDSDDDVYIDFSSSSDFVSITSNAACNNIFFTEDGAGISVNGASTQTFTVLGNIDFQYFECNISLGDSDLLKIAGNFLNRDGSTLTVAINPNAASVVEYNGSVAQDVWGKPYGILKLSGSGDKTLNEDFAIQSRGTFNGSGKDCFVSTASGLVTFGSTQTTTFTVASGGLSSFQTIPALNFNNLTLSGARTVANITFSSGTTKIYGAFNIPKFTTGSVVLTGSTIEYASTSASQTVLFTYLKGSPTAVATNLQYNNVILSGSGEKVIAGTATNPNLSSIVSGTITLNVPTVKYSGGYSQTVINGTYDGLTLSASGTKTIDGTVAAASFNQTGVAVEYTGASSQNVLAGSYGTLSFSGAGAKEITGAVTTTTINANAATINIAGSVTATTFNAGTSTVNFTAAGNQSINSGMMFYNLSLSGSGSKTLGGALAVSNNLTVSGTSSFETVSNAVTVGGKLTNGSTVNKSSGLFTLNGDFENNGAFSIGTGKLVFGGSTPSAFSGTTPITVADVDVSKTSNTLTLSNSLTIQPLSKFTITNATTTVAAGGNLTLGADITGYALIPAIPTGSSIAGSVTAKAYIPATVRTWWHLSNPVSTPAASQWQDDFSITGAFTGANTITGSNLQSMFGYNESVAGASDNGWVNFPSAANTETMTNGKGYRAFIRDSKTVSSPKTLDVTGTLLQGNVSIPLDFTNTASGDDGWNFIGNPYPATLDWSNLTADADLLDANAYVWKAVSKTYDYSTSIKIAPFQAFFVQAQNAGSLNLTESMKSTGGALAREANVANKITIELTDNGVDPAFNLVNTELVINPDATLGFDKEFDASYLSRNFMSSLGEDKLADLASVTSNGKRMRRNFIPESEEVQTIPLHVDYSSLASYTFNINTSDYSYSDPLTLVDYFLNKEMVFEEALQYSFTTTSDPNSKSTARFALKVGARPVGVNESESASVSKLELFPNPTVGKVNVKLSSIYTDVEVAVVDMLGNEVYKEFIQNTASSLSKEISLDKLGSGVYLVKATHKGAVFTEKLVVNKL